MIKQYFIQRNISFVLYSTVISPAICLHFATISHTFIRWIGVGNIVSSTDTVTDWTNELVRSLSLSLAHGRTSMPSGWRRTQRPPPHCTRAKASVRRSFWGVNIHIHIRLHCRRVVVVSRGCVCVCAVRVCVYVWARWKNPLISYTLLIATSAVCSSS